MLQKVFSIIGCVFMSIILSLALGIGANILVNTVKDIRAEKMENAEDYEPGDEYGDSEAPEDGAAAETP